MEFTFRLTQYESDNLEDEITVALDKQAELYSRNRLPAMWRFIDRNRSRRASERVIKLRNVYMKIYGIIMLMMGIILLVPGLMEPKKLLLPLIAGMIAVLIGIGCIWPWRKRSIRKYRKIADKLLAGLRTLDETTETPLLVCFTVEGMSLLNTTLIRYQDFQTIIETESMYFLVWKDSVTILQKKDLGMESSDDFLAFLEEMTTLHRITVETTP